MILIVWYGVFDLLMKPFTAERYQGEMHAYSLPPSTFLKHVNFVGPGAHLVEILNEDLTPE